jgi:hypothetical protein
MRTKSEREALRNRVCMLHLVCPQAVLSLVSTTYHGAEIDKQICRFVGLPSCKDSYETIRAMANTAFPKLRGWKHVSQAEHYYRFRSFADLGTRLENINKEMGNEVSVTGN